MTTNLNIVPPREVLVDEKGKITDVWWRYFQNMFSLFGGYQANTGPNATLAAVATLAYSEFGPSGTDYDREISDLDTLMGNVPDDTGRIAQLEARVNRLETLLAYIDMPTTDLTNLQREADMSQAFILGGP